MLFNESHQLSDIVGRALAVRIQITTQRNQRCGKNPIGVALGDPDPDRPHIDAQPDSTDPGRHALPRQPRTSFSIAASSTGTWSAGTPPP